MPVRDAKDDFTLKAGEEKNGITILKFERHFDTCDPQDIKIKVCFKLFMEYLPLACRRSYIKLLIDPVWR